MASQFVRVGQHLIRLDSIAYVDAPPGGSGGITAFVWFTGREKALHLDLAAWKELAAAMDLSPRESVHSTRSG